MFSFRTSILVFSCIICTIAQATKKNDREQKARTVVTVVAAKKAFPGPEYTATLKQRNPPPLMPQKPLTPQKRLLTECPASTNLLALKGRSPETAP